MREEEGSEGILMVIWDRRKDGLIVDIVVIRLRVNSAAFTANFFLSFTTVTARTKLPVREVC